MLTFFLRHFGTNGGGIIPSFDLGATTKTHCAKNWSDWRANRAGAPAAEGFLLPCKAEHVVFVTDKVTGRLVRAHRDQTRFSGR